MVSNALHRAAAAASSASTLIRIDDGRSRIRVVRRGANTSVSSCAPFHRFHPGPKLTAPGRTGRNRHELARASPELLAVGPMLSDADAWVAATATATLDRSTSLLHVLSDAPASASLADAVSQPSQVPSAANTGFDYQRWGKYAFMFPVSTGVATTAMLTGIGGAALFTPIFLLGFPLLGDQYPLKRWKVILLNTEQSLIE